MTILPRIIYITSAIFVGLTILFSEYVLNFIPCEICLIERIPWIFLFLTCILIKNKKYLIIICSILLLISVGLSIFHTGIEMQFWKSPFASCVQKSTNISNLLIKSIPPKPCDSPNYIFSFIPISMTTMGGLYALFILIISSIIPKLLKK